MIVIVAKKPEPGRVKTRLCPPLTPPQTARLAEAFLRETVQLARSALQDIAIGFSPDDTVNWFETEFPHVTLLPQGTGDLGHRMAHLFVQAFATESEPVILVGADTPQLSPQRLTEAAAELEGDTDLVLGPAADGGYYLVGLKSPTPELFRNIDWGSATVLRQTVERANTLGLQVALLREERDIDEPADLEWIMSQPGPYGEMVRSTIRG